MRETSTGCRLRRLSVYGERISFIPDPARHRVEQLAPVDLAAPVHGPFSADFRWVTLPDWPHGPIRCTEGQAAVFEALWSFKGVEVDGERVMQRAGLGSGKPNDLFKVKAQYKGKPEREGPLFAYRALVRARKREGLYAMPCAGSVLSSPTCSAPAHYLRTPANSAN